MLPDLAERPPAGLPAATWRHLADCPACHRALAAARVARGSIAALGDAPEPPAEFAARVLRALLVARIAAPADPWRLAWVFLPAFAAVVAALFLLPAPGLESDLPGLLSLRDLSASEQLVFSGDAPHPDLVLAAVLEDVGP
jgi:hypothetical protein